MLVKGATSVTEYFSLGDGFLLSQNTKPYI